MIPPPKDADEIDMKNFSSDLSLLKKYFTSNGVPEGKFNDRCLLFARNLIFSVNFTLPKPKICILNRFIYSQS